MKPALFLFAFFMIGKAAIAQEDAGIQPGTLYKTLRVKSRTETGGARHSKNVIYFNQQGVITKIVDYQQEETQERRFLYDTAGFLRQELSFFYPARASKYRLLVDSLLPLTRFFYYDALGFPGVVNAGKIQGWIFHHG